MIYRLYRETVVETLIHNNNNNNNNNNNYNNNNFMSQIIECLILICIECMTLDIWGKKVLSSYIVLVHV